MVNNLNEEMCDYEQNLERYVRDGCPSTICETIRFSLTETGGIVWVCTEDCPVLSSKELTSRLLGEAIVKANSDYSAGKDTGLQVKST